MIVQPGPITGPEQSEAETLFAAAERSFESRRFFEVLRTTDDLLERFPASAVSGEALRLAARAALEAGDFARAEAASDRYLALLSEGDPRATDMRLVQSAALVLRPVDRLDRLLRIDAGASLDELQAATEQLREAFDSLAVDTLQAIVDSADVESPLLATAQARLAVVLLERGRIDDARLYADRALTGGVAGEERTWAEGVLEGELPPGRGRSTSFRVAVVLPVTGPPAMADFSRLVAEGVEVAAATVLGDGYAVSVDVYDDEGDPERSAALVAQLEAEGVEGIVGFLQDDALVAAAQGRSVPIPIVSPTARTADRAGEAVYSLEGPNLEAATSVAAYAASRAFQRVAMLYPQSAEAEAEADAFAAAAGALGIPVVGRFTYEVGATFFEAPIIGARDALRRVEIQALGLTEDDTLHVELLDPVALFVPIPPEDVEFVAPQVVHYGLDTLAIEVLGTSGWTDAQALAAVEPRLTTGVVATASVRSDSASEGRARFMNAYEEHFQRTMLGVAPAVGYDAMLLLLEALRPGRITPEQVNQSMQGLNGVAGATGVFSVVDGLVVRRTEVVRIDGGDFVPVVPSVVNRDPPGPGSH